ncbi:MAG TPA: pilin [Candidatus Saccharimonadales bacterium]
MNNLILLSKILATTCGGKSPSDFLGFPTWYEYLPTNIVNGVCSPQLTSINDVWLIVAAVIEILLRIAALMAVGFIIYGGIQFTTSQGNPQQTNQAKGTIISAVVGLAICLIATVLITFVAGSIK